MLKKVFKNLFKLLNTDLKKNNLLLNFKTYICKSCCKIFIENLKIMVNIKLSCCEKEFEKTIDSMLDVDCLVERMDR